MKKLLIIVILALIAFAYGSYSPYIYQESEFEEVLSENACSQCHNGGWNFGHPGTDRWCHCCRNDCGGFQGACRNQGFGSSLCVANRAPSAPTCECVDYIRNKFGISCGSAKDYPRCLGGGGSPRKGGIVVFLTCHPWADNRHGHIAELIDFNDNSLFIRGTNHGGATRTSDGCNNVADVWWPRSGDGCIRYY